MFVPLNPGFPIACGFGNDKTNSSGLNVSLKDRRDSRIAEFTLGKKTRIEADEEKKEKKRRGEGK